MNELTKTLLGIAASGLGLAAMALFALTKETNWGVLAIMMLQVVALLELEKKK